MGGHPPRPRAAFGARLLVLTIGGDFGQRQLAVGWLHVAAVCWDTRIGFGQQTLAVGGWLVVAGCWDASWVLQQSFTDDLRYAAGLPERTSRAAE